MLQRDHNNDENKVRELINSYNFHLIPIQLYLFKEIICMKRQTLFSKTNKKIIISLSSAEFAQEVQVHWILVIRQFSIKLFWI